MEEWQVYVFVAEGGARLLREHWSDIVTVAIVVGAGFAIDEVFRTVRWAHGAARRAWARVGGRK